MTTESRHVVRVTVNARVTEVAVSPRRTLLHVLREDLHLTGAKEGTKSVAAFTLKRSK